MRPESTTDMGTARRTCGRAPELGPEPEPDKDDVEGSGEAHRQTQPVFGARHDVD